LFLLILKKEVKDMENETYENEEEEDVLDICFKKLFEESREFIILKVSADSQLNLGNKVVEKEMNFRILEEGPKTFDWAKNNSCGYGGMENGREEKI
jgi:hypothetical protein